MMKKSIKILEKYNSLNDVVRCPYGRAKVRKLLDSYTKAAVKLYGIISRKNLVGIFNEQSSYNTDTEEIYLLLLPFVIKEGL